MRGRLGQSLTFLRHAGNLDLSVIAEGVETTEQLEKLQRLGGRFAQGYLFAKPLDADRAEDLLASWDPTRFAAAALN